jgi:hypothetical protein
VSTENQGAAPYGCWLPNPQPQSDTITRTAISIKMSWCDLSSGLQNLDKRLSSLLAEYHKSSAI